MEKFLTSYDQLGSAAKMNVKEIYSEPDTSALYSIDGSECYVPVTKLPLDVGTLTAYLTRNWHNQVLPLVKEEYGYGVDISPIAVLGQAFRESLDGILQALKYQFGAYSPTFNNFKGNRCSIFLSEGPDNQVRFNYVNRGKLVGGMHSFSIEGNRKNLEASELLKIFQFITAYHTNELESVGRANKGFPIRLSTR